jgi:short-subunit dehydrogenase
MTNTLIIGATSAIAQAVARRFAADGATLFLIARDEAKLNAVAEDMRVRGAQTVDTAVLDVLDYDQHGAVIQHVVERQGRMDVVLIAHGTLPDQKACEASFEHTRREFETNALSVMSLLTHVANYFEREKRGTIAVIASVAGDRGRRSNYVYGAAKGAVSLFMQGLRNRLAPAGVHVLTIKPGFVDTPMTSEFEKGLLWAQPDRVARDIQRAIEKKKDIAYVPPFWRYIMLVIGAIPEFVFKRLRL